MFTSSVVGLLALRLDAPDLAVHLRHLHPGHQVHQRNPDHHRRFTGESIRETSFRQSAQFKLKPGQQQPSHLSRFVKTLCHSHWGHSGAQSSQFEHSWLSTWLSRNRRSLWSSIAFGTASSLWDLVSKQVKINLPHFDQYLI